MGGNVFVVDKPSSKHIGYMSDVYRLRHKVFCEDKAWLPKNKERQEVDLYDRLNAVHFIHVDEAGKVDGCCRILPSTGPNMLRDIFPELMGNQPIPSGQTIWEISRFTVDTERLNDSYTTISHVTSELLIALFRYAVAHEINTIIAVTDTAFERILRRAGLYTVRYAPPRKFHNCEAVAGYAVANEETIRLLEERQEKNQRRHFKSYEQEAQKPNQIEVRSAFQIQQEEKHIA